MRHTHIAIACLAALLLVGNAAVAQRTKRGQQPSPSQQQQQSEAEDRQAIDKMHQHEIDANLALDVDKIASTWDDDIVSLPPHSKPIEGLAANRAYLDAQRKALANVDILGYEQNWNEVRMLGDYVYEWGVIRERFQAAASNKELDLTYNVMRVLKRQPDGEFKIYRQIWNDRAENTESPQDAPKQPTDKPPAQ